jgi:hypothetical protein
MPLPNVPTTPEQWAVIAWTTALVLAVIGAVAFYFSTDAAPPNDVQLRQVALAAFGLAAFVLLAKWLIGRYLA